MKPTIRRAALLLFPLLALPAAVPAAAELTARGVELSDYLPAGVRYDPAIPTPASVLGFAVGSRHVSHDRLVTYMERLAAASERVRLEVQGHTHEGRPLLVLTISSPAHLGRLEEIRRRHVALSEGERLRDPEAPAEAIDGMPAVVYLGYSIHGNEASGSNASLLVAYHLAAAESEEVERILEETVVLLDPSLNPDGLQRFASWANTHRGAVPVGEPLHREHTEAWPGGRTNHYWFDLNRDWLLLQHPESRARVATFQRWRPNVLADFHEMGSDSTYFFQPGVPSRTNPLTPEGNVRLTERIARYHADALDREGRLYFTEERFDDFYYGKGSTYPDVQGAVGILFEQASARGHQVETDQGRLTFPFAVSNQFLTSLSTLRAAADLSDELLAYQRLFYREGLELGRDSETAGWVFGDERDPARGRLMVELLLAHGIRVHPLARRLERDGRAFEPGSAWVVPAEQRQFRLVRALFDRPTEFADSTFYDVSAWTLPLALDMPSAELPELASGVAGSPLEEPPPLAGRAPATSATAAYAFEWTGYWAPRALARLFDAGVEARVATLPFSAETDDGRRRFGHGTILVPVGPRPAEAPSAGVRPPGAQEVTPERLHALVREIAAEDGIDVWSLATGLTAAGVDVGSPSVRPLEPPRPLLVVGDGVSGYAAGEIWHLLDHRFGIGVPLVERRLLERVDLGEHTHVVLVDGRWRDLDDEVVERLRSWVREGGTLVATEAATRFARAQILEPGRDGEEGESEEATPERERQRPGRERQETREEEEEDAPEAEETARVTYADFEQDRAVELVSGTVFEVELDTTHPIAFGYTDPLLPVFRSGTAVLEPSEDPYENVALYTQEPLLAGYASPRQVERIAGSASAVATRLGAGTVVLLADDPSFRAYWRGTEKLFLNAIYFGKVVKETSAPASWR